MSLWLELENQITVEGKFEIGETVTVPLHTNPATLSNCDSQRGVVDGVSNKGNTAFAGCVKCEESFKLTK